MHVDQWYTSLLFAVTLVVHLAVLLSLDTAVCYIFTDIQISGHHIAASGRGLKGVLSL